MFDEKKRIKIKEKRNNRRNSPYITTLLKQKPHEKHRRENRCPCF
jgi:hypothetical protein